MGEVKRVENFCKLLVVQISEKFEFEGKMVDRKALANGYGNVARYSRPSKPSAE